MNIISTILVSIVAYLHVYFLILEMFLWTKPKGLKTFGINKEYAEKSKVLAANQGLYNGFLAAGLIWSLIEPDIETAFVFQVFFLICVIIAGSYGAYSTKKLSLFYIQAVPAVLALAFILLTKNI